MADTYKPSYGEMEKWEQEGPWRVRVIKRLFFKNSVLKSGWFPKNSTQVVLYVHVNPHIHDHVHTHEEKQVPALVKWGKVDSWALLSN